MYMSSKDNKKQINSPIVLSNPRIIEFYNKNKQIDVEQVNLLYIDLLENIINTSIDTPSIVNQIMVSLGNQNRDLNNLLAVVSSSSEIHKNELSNIKSINALTNENIKNEIDSLKNVITNLGTFITTKLYETKDNYIKELRETLKNTDSNSILTIGTTVEKNNSLLIDKIMLILTDIVPKSHNKHYEDIIKIFKEDMNTSLDRLKNSNPENAIDKISSLVDNKYSNLVFNIQDTMMKYISQSEDRLTNNITQVKDISAKNTVIQDKINEELSVYLNKYKISASKGSISENNLYNIIEQEYPSSELSNTSNFTGMGDMILKRKEKIPILIENKDYTTNIKKEETDKFFRDITKNKYHGIFISQHSGIVGKENFQIDMHNNNILIYIHYCDYDIDKIKLAINTIDTLSDKFIDINIDSSSISREMIKNINYDYQSFLSNRESVLNVIKDNYKKTLDIFTHLKLPSLEKYLSLHFADTKKNKLLCSYCKKYETDNLRSLARHSSSCKKNITQSIDTINDGSSNTNSDISPEVPCIEDIAEPDMIHPIKIKTTKIKKSKDQKSAA
jgi:hypothetical protein